MPMPNAIPAARPGDFSPPMMAAVKPLTLYSRPVSQDTVVMGAMMIPARPPMAPPAANTARLTRPVLMPIKRAAIVLVETALIARPERVELKYQNVATMVTAVTAHTQRAWIGMN